MKVVDKISIGMNFTNLDLILKVRFYVLFLCGKNSDNYNLLFMKNKNKLLLTINYSTLYYQQEPKSGYSKR